MLPIFTLRERGNRYKIIIEKDLNFEFADNGNEEIKNISKFVKLLEKYVEQYPDEWEFWDNLKERISGKPMVFRD